MNKKIEFDYKEKHYVLEYNRDAIMVMEKQGFDLDQYTSKPMTMISLAFQGAFIKNHRGVNGATVQEIFDNLGNKEKLSNQLIEMISETYSSLFEDNKSDGKNISWKTV